MSRLVVTAIFVVAAVATGFAAAAEWRNVLADPTLRPVAVAGHATLKFAVVLAFTVFVFLRDPSRRPSREPVAFLACAAALASVVFIREPAGSASTLTVVVGDLVAVAFGVFLLAAVLALGRCFGILPEARGLVTRGPYRLVRHPVYLGELGAAAGLVVAAPSAWNAGALTVFFAAQAVRMRLEERALTAEFPEYREYAARTPRLVPRLRRPRRIASSPGGAVPFAALAVTVALAAAPAQAADLATPTIAGPAEGATADGLPAFGWNAVTRAERYEWQIAADPAFNSPVLGSAHDRFFTLNTRATMTKVVPNGTYWWRVRAVAPDGAVSPWSPGRSFTKLWAAAPTLQSPADGATIEYPEDLFRLAWTAVPGAARYLVRIATDPSLASLVLPGNGIETQATAYTLLGPLAPDKTYYWGITPIDAAGNHGNPSAVWSFVWRWPSETTPVVTDVASEPEIDDYRFSWDPVPGAAGYEMQISSSSDFAPGSLVNLPMSNGVTTIGTSYSPTLVLPNNNRYYWRVRAVDANRNAGTWNVGPEFSKAFGGAVPSIKNLRMADDPLAGQPGYQTTTPIVLWDPVPGASSYDVEVTRFVGGCQWTATTEHWRSTTAATAWTPLGSGWNFQKPYANPLAVSTDLPSLVAGHSYCVRVTALDRPMDFTSPYIRSTETYLPDANSPAFTWLGPPTGDACSPSCEPGALGSGDYLLPVTGSTTGVMPYFRWNAIAGAQSYFVLVAKDADFTNLVDYAFAQVPAYAPRTQLAPRTYPDETTLYYWAVLPATGRDGSGVTTAPRFSAPSSFHKQSVPPTLLAPAPGTVFSATPTFHWAPATGARRYQLQVSSDPSFAGQIREDVVTDSTSYTSGATYPADTTLYWRVRADAETDAASGAAALAWSAPGTFRKTLLAPVPALDNPSAGDVVPTWRWGLVPGAVAYDFQLRYPNGNVTTFAGLPSAAATPTLLKGTGIWTWQVRAKFPQLQSLVRVDGPWSPSQSFTRTIREPASPREEVAGRRVVFQWDPKLGALNYRVQVSTRADFGTIVESTTTENTTYAPRLTQFQYAAGGTFYWRVAAADDAIANVGDFTAPRSVTLPPVTILRAGSRITVKVRRVKRTLRVTGVVTPAHRGSVTVALARRQRGAFRPVASRAALLKANSSYATSFPRPARGACRVVARFPGDRDHLPSSVTLRFRC